MALFDCKKRNLNQLISDSIIFMYLIKVSQRRRGMNLHGMYRRKLISTLKSNTKVIKDQYVTLAWHGFW